MKPSMILYTAHASQLDADPRNPDAGLLEIEAEGVTLYLSERDLSKLEAAWGFKVDADRTAEDLRQAHAWVARWVTPPTA